VGTVRMSIRTGEAVARNSSIGAKFDPNHKCLLGIISGKFTFTRWKVTKKLLNILFRQSQFATLCLLNSDPDATACPLWSLVVLQGEHRLTSLAGSRFLKPCRSKLRKNELV